MSYVKVSVTYAGMCYICTEVWQYDVLNPVFSTLYAVNLKVCENKDAQM